MSRKLFVVSDVHGHFAALMEALYDAGFDKTNEDHIFVSCGDLFDRGNGNEYVYKFVRSLERKILIKGNHEDMLRDILDSGGLDDDNIDNGADKTVLELLGNDAIVENQRIHPKYAEKGAEIIDFIDSMCDYFEEGQYIFTHGWVPILVDDDHNPSLAPNWRDASKEDWIEARWVGWHEVYGTDAMIEGKTVVCGHRPAQFGRMFDDTREPDCNLPFFGEGLIAIDTYTARTNQVSVLVIENGI